jgi:precorrin-6B methylase 2
MIRPSAASTHFPALLKKVVGPHLDRLLERLDAPTASFLDVGVGVAALSIEMARHRPSLHVVGIDPWPASLLIARENVNQAGVATRVALRKQVGEALSDVEAFDLAWVASAFIPEQAIPKVVERATIALRPGGWLLLPMANPGNDTLGAALTGFRTALWGGCLLSVGAAEALLRRSGLTAVQMLPGPPRSSIAFIAGRRQCE